MIVTLYNITLFYFLETLNIKFVMFAWLFRKAALCNFSTFLHEYVNVEIKMSSQLNKQVYMFNHSSKENSYWTNNKKSCKTNILST